MFTGVLTEEGGGQLTLVGPNGQPQVVARSNLEELASTGKSALPLYGAGASVSIRPENRLAETRGSIALHE